MKISVAGHLWENRFRLASGTSRNAAIRESKCPGGALWLLETLKTAGLEVALQEVGESLRIEHYDCRELPDKEKKEGLVAFQYAGCTPGETQALPESADLLVVLDEGLEPVREFAKPGMLLWASRERLPESVELLLFPKETVLLLDADLLRRSGALISRQISWERTATDTVWQLQNNPAFRSLLSAGEIIVAFAEEGFLTLRLQEGGQRAASLYLASGAAEGAARSESPSAWPMAWETAVASAAMALAQNGIEAVPETFPAAAEMLRRGCRSGDFESGCWIAPAVSALQKKYSLGCYSIPVSAGDAQPDRDYIRFLDQISETTTDVFAERIVREGLQIIAGIPRVTFGKLTSIDRSEIESFMNVRNLIASYAGSDELRPLSIAVFGSPGSGKSFGVTQIAENTLAGRLQRIEFNVSQFTKRSDLTAALHKVRDIALGGRLPLVFFDEFDADFEGQRLGWLKSFLMPMQDGKFFDGESEHPVGRCIFVFAGGTSASVEQFCLPLSPDASEEQRRQFTDRKGPDFVSRLRGTLNVLGPNRSNDRPKSFLLRRAVLLRGLCERKLKNCFSGNWLRIDESVLTVMLLVPKYLHGARSMEAIIDMSRLEGARSWGPAALPVDSQLALHVDAGAFKRLLLRDVLLGSCREKLARQIHENYRALQSRQHNTESKAAALEWERLTEEYREANRAQADDIIVKLGRFGYGFDTGDTFFEAVTEFPPDKLGDMARAEHRRWCEQKRKEGWTYAPGEKNEEKKTTPYLAEWEELDEKVRELDRDAVRKIIPLLSGIGLRVYKRD